ncbi:MAG: HNH endonuclease signature motif containing protein [Caulobacterales bacterium]
MTLTAAELREILTYDPETGVFTRRIQTCNNHKVGDVCNTVANNGYVLIGVKSKRWYAHRLAWLYVHGTWPDGQIDHINGVRTDNRISNLRTATQSQQNGNQRIHDRNTSGRRGVSWCKKRQMWRAYIRPTTGQKHLGYFTNLDDAAAAFDAAAVDYFGEFARLNETLVSRVPASSPQTREVTP